MKSRNFKNIAGFFECALEKLREWTDYIRYCPAWRKERRNSVCEVYSIKREYMNLGYVKTFLEERRRAAMHNGYTIQFNSNYVSGENDEIGCVALLCRGRIIDSAVLTAGSATSEEDRLILWNFR